MSNNAKQLSFFTIDLMKSVINGEELLLQREVKNSQMQSK